MPRRSEVVQALIRKLDDEEPQVVEAAARALMTIGDASIQQLVEALSEAPLLLRESLLRVLSELEMPEAEIVGPVRREMEAAYGLVAEQDALEALEASPGRDFLVDGLRADLAIRIRAVFRLLRAVGLAREVDLIERGLASPDRRRRAVAVEGVEKVTHSGVARLLVPLVDELPLWERMAAGTKAFGTTRPSLEGLLRSSLDSGDLVRQIGACVLLAELGEVHRWTEPLQRLASEAPPPVALQARVSQRGREEGEPMLSTLDKVIFLRKVELFTDLDVRGLTAIATIAEERTITEGEYLCRQGDPGDSMFFIVEGMIQVLRDAPDGTAVELAEVGPPEYLGEMALFEDRPRTASLRAREETTYLEINGPAFRMIMSEYPQVGASASRTLSQRLRGVLEREDRLRAAGTLSERRAHPRVATDLIAAREEDRAVRLHNLSRGGAYFVEDEPSTPGQRMVLTVELSEGEPLGFAGTVQRCERAAEGEGFGTAVVFDEVSEEVAQALDRWVEASQTGEL